MRAEAVVGQGFPVREGDHRQGRVAAEQGVQVGFELVGTVVVTGDHQQRGVVARAAWARYQARAVGEAGARHQARSWPARGSGGAGYEVRDMDPGF
jgi:hypothetical protein